LEFIFDISFTLKIVELNSKAMFSMMPAGFPYHFNKCVNGICSIVLEQGTWNPYIQRDLLGNFNLHVVVLISTEKDALPVWLLNLYSEWPITGMPSGFLSS